MLYQRSKGEDVHELNGGPRFSKVQNAQYSNSYTATTMNKIFVSFPFLVKLEAWNDTWVNDPVLMNLPIIFLLHM